MYEEVNNFNTTKLSEVGIRDVYLYKPVFLLGNRGIAYLSDNFTLSVDNDCSIYVNRGLVHVPETSLGLNRSELLNALFKSIYTSHINVIDLDTLIKHL